MNIGMVVLGTIVGGVLLFIWGGFTQNVLPWGIKSVATPSDADQEKIGSAIASVSTHGMMLVGKQVTAFLAIRVETYYSAGRYLIIEFFTQILVAFTLSAILALTVTMPLDQRLLLVVLVSLVSIFSSDFQNWNWWGFSNIYLIGIATSRIIGHALVGFILANFIIRV